MSARPLRAGDRVKIVGPRVNPDYRGRLGTVVFVGLAVKAADVTLDDVNASPFLFHVDELERLDA